MLLPKLCEVSMGVFLLSHQAFTLTEQRVQLCGDAQLVCVGCL